MQFLRSLFLFLFLFLDVSLLKCVSRVYIRTCVYTYQPVINSLGRAQIEANVVENELVTTSGQRLRYLEIQDEDRVVSAANVLRFDCISVSHVSVNDEFAYVVRTKDGAALVRVTAILAPPSAKSSDAQHPISMTCDNDCIVGMCRPYCCVRIPGIYLRGCMNAYMHAYLHAYMHICMHMYMYICIQACMNTCMHLRKLAHECIHTSIHTYVHTYINAYLQTYIHT